MCKVTDTSTTINNSDSPVKPDHPYKPIFHPSLVSKKATDERGPAATQRFSNEHSHKSLSSRCAVSNSVEAANSSGGQIGSTVVTPAAVIVPNKVISGSCMHKVCVQLAML